MSSLPECMYDYRYDREEEDFKDVEVIGMCCMCGRAVTDMQDFTVTDGQYVIHDKCIK